MLNGDNTTRLHVSSLLLDVTLHPQLPHALPPPVSLHILGFLPAARLGCPPSSAVYVVRPLAGADSGKPAPLYVALLTYLTGSNRPQPSEALVAAARTDSGRTGFLAAERVPLTGDATAYRLVYSALHATHRSYASMHQLAAPSLSGLEFETDQVQQSVARVLKLVQSLPAKEDALQSACLKLLRQAAAFGMPDLASALMECLAEQQAGLKTKTASRSLARVLQALEPETPPLIQPT